MADGSSPWTLDGVSASLRLGSFSATVKVDQPELGLHAVSWDGMPIVAVQRWLGFAEARPLVRDKVRAIEDAYVRGRDLVAIYAETKDHPLRYVLYWRALDAEALGGAVAGVDVVASVQTSVLDAKPAAFFSSQCCVDEARMFAPPERDWKTIPAQLKANRPLKKEERLQTALDTSAAGRAAGDDTFLFELAESPWSYAEMIHPRDRILSYATVHEIPGVAMPGSALPNDADSSMRVAGASHHVLGLPLEKGVLLRARLRVLFMPRAEARDIATRSREQFEQAELPLTT